MKMPPGGMQNFLRQARQLQSRIEKKEKELDENMYEATSGGEAIKVVVSGEYQIKSVTLSDEFKKSQDPEMLCDLIQAATNEALKKAKIERKTELDKLNPDMAGGLF